MIGNQYPSIIESERANLAAYGIRAKEGIERKLEEARKLLKKDPDLAKVKTVEAQGDARLFQEAAREFQVKLNAFDQTRLAHGEKIQEADKAINDAISRLTALKDRGYFVSPEAELSPAKNEVKIARDILGEKGDVPDYCSVIKHAEEAARRASSVQDIWQRRCDRKIGNEAKLADVRMWREKSLPQLENSCKIALSALKIKTPPDVWGTVDAQIKNQEALKTELDNLIQKAEYLNGMEKQDFATAGVMVDKIQAVRSSIKTALERPGKTMQEFIEAQVKAKNMALQAAGAINQAERAISDSDAEGAGRDKLRKAKEEISKARDLEKSNLPNWLLVAGLLAGAIALSQSAASEAKSRANEVERVRRKRRDEEEKKEKEEKAASYSSYSWSSGSSSGGSSGGGFGGFGGGSFGGGGASGRW